MRGNEVDCGGGSSRCAPVAVDVGEGGGGGGGG